MGKRKAFFLTFCVLSLFQIASSQPFPLQIPPPPPPLHTHTHTTITHTHSFYRLSLQCLSFRLTSTEARWPIRDGDRVGRGRESERLDRGNRPKKTGETVDRRQNNRSVKAVSPRHCPATCALRNCSFNCCAGQSLRQCPLHRC